MEVMPAATPRNGKGTGSIEKSRRFALPTSLTGTIVNMIFNLQDPNFYCLTSEIESLDINDLL